MALARYPRVDGAGLGEEVKRVQGAAKLNGFSTIIGDAKEWQALSFFVDEDKMISGLPRDDSKSSDLHPYVLFP